MSRRLKGSRASDHSIEVCQLVSVTYARAGDEEGQGEPHPAVRPDVAGELHARANILRLQPIFKGTRHVVGGVANTVASWGGGLFPGAVISELASFDAHRQLILFRRERARRKVSERARRVVGLVRRMSLPAALPTTFAPGFSQNSPATVSHPSSACNSASRLARSFRISSR